MGPLERRVRPHFGGRACSYLDSHQLLATGRARDEADGTTSDAELVGDQAEQRLVGRTGDGGCRDVGAENSVDHAVDMIGSGSRSQSDGEADVGVSQDGSSLAAIVATTRRSLQSGEVAQ